MKKFFTILLLASLSFAAAPEELKPIAYSCVTNFAVYEGPLMVVTNSGPVMSFRVQKTNVPVALVHSVFYGRGTNAVFVQNTSELLPVNVPEGWYSWKSYQAATWISLPQLSTTNSQPR